MAELDPGVLESLDRLSTSDPVAALDAGVALSWLVGSHGLDRLHQAGLQQFLWYELPFKWLGPVEGRRTLVDALARFFEIAGLPRYAAVCRSKTTAELLEVWADDAVAGFDAFHAAHVGSGVVPPDLDDLVWGDLMGDAELAAFWSTAQSLELAVEADALRPGTRGWKAAQARLARRHLEQPRPERFGESLRQAVMTERLASWSEQGRGDARSALVGPVTNLLLHDAAAPPGAGRAVRPLLWLTLSLERPVQAGAAGGLPPRFVREASTRFGWGRVSSRAAESELPTLSGLRELAVSIRLVRKSSGRWEATARGLDMVTDPSRLWEAAAGALGAQAGFAGAVGELLDAMLLAGERPRRHELRSALVVPTTEEGWHGGHSGRPVPADVLEAEIERQLAMRLAVGAISRRGGQPAEPVRLTAGGVALARASLRSRALRPRTRH